MECSYQFADGTVVKVTVTDEKLSAALTKLAEEERKDVWRSEKRARIAARFAETGGLKAVHEDQYFTEARVESDAWISDARLMSIWPRLSLLQRELLLLRYVEGLTQAEIAALKGIKQASVSYHFKMIGRKLAAI